LIITAAHLTAVVAKDGCAHRRARFCPRSFWSWAHLKMLLEEKSWLRSTVAHAAMWRATLARSGHSCGRRTRRAVPHCLAAGAAIYATKQVLYFDRRCSHDRKLSWSESQMPVLAGTSH